MLNTPAEDFSTRDPPYGRARYSRKAAKDLQGLHDYPLCAGTGRWSLRGSSCTRSAWVGREPGRAPQAAGLADFTFHRWWSLATNLRVYPQVQGSFRPLVAFEWLAASCSYRPSRETARVALQTQSEDSWGLWEAVPLSHTLLIDGTSKLRDRVETIGRGRLRKSMESIGEKIRNYIPCPTAVSGDLQHAPEPAFVECFCSSRADTAPELANLPPPLPKCMRLLEAIVNKEQQTTKKGLSVTASFLMDYWDIWLWHKFI